MLYRRFGRTGLSMPVFSCGGMRYQNSWKDQKPDAIPDDNQRNLEATIRRSLEVGVNHIETARDYGTSEMQLGRILPTLPRDAMIVQTKVMPAAEPERFLERFETSMGYLGLDRVDLLAIHGINTPEHLEWSIRPGGCIEAARAIRGEGRADWIGFSTHGPLDVILRAIETDAFDYVNLHWYFINQANWPAIEAARAHDMGVFIISPSDKGGALYSPSERLRELCEPFSPMVFNDLFCLSRPEVHTLSVGAARPSDFDEHLKALGPLSGGPEAAARAIESVVERLERAMRDACGEEWLRTREVGLPRYDATPGEVNVPVMLWLRDLVRAYDMVEYGRNRYNLLGAGGHWFPGRKLASPEAARSPEMRAALAGSPHAELIPEMLIETDRVLGGESVRRLSQSD